jgi:hypothetical protein
MLSKEIKISNHSKYSSSMKSIIFEMIFFCALYVFNPILGLLLAYFFLVTAANTKYRYVGTSTAFLQFISILLAFYLGCINSTKSAYNDPDLTWYLAGFLDAGRQDFLHYILNFGINGKGKELGFPFFNYIIYFIIGPSKSWYIILYTTVCYSFLNFAYIKFCKAIKVSYTFTISGLFFIAFLPFVFAISAVILRQFLAGSVLMYILVRNCFYGKKSWGLAIFMVLCHTTSFFFLPFIYTPFFNKYISKKTIFYYLGGLLFLIFIQQIAAVSSVIFSSDSAIGYALDRASRNTTTELQVLTVSKIIILIFLASVPIYIIYVKDRMLRFNKGLIRFTNLLMILVVFILINLDQVELTVRFNAYTWMFFAFILALASNQFKVLNKVSIFVVLLTIAYFFLTLHSGMWVYKTKNIYTNSLIDYF